MPLGAQLGGAALPLPRALDKHSPPHPVETVTLTASWMARLSATLSRRAVVGFSLQSSTSSKSKSPLSSSPFATRPTRMTPRRVLVMCSVFCSLKNRPKYAQRGNQGSHNPEAVERPEFLRKGDVHSYAGQSLHARSPPPPNLRLTQPLPWSRPLGAHPRSQTRRAHCCPSLAHLSSQTQL